ncbi:MAG TPA: PxKF domain-containing protein [Gemmatimonadaceae bacterium]|nr:PxKF domain-containing protein [Gemmatimonadaceae bacterium]
MRHRVIEHILHDSMKKIVLSVSVLAFAAACDGSPTSPTKTVGPNVSGPTFDDIANQLDNSIDAIAEVMPLTVGGATGTTTLYVNPTNGDGKNGCNLTGSTALTLSVSSNNTAVATVSPSSVTFTSCGDIKTLTITPINPGTATISVSQTSNTTPGTFTLAPATFTVNVTPPPNTAPSVSVAGVAGGASYNKGSVPAATCQVTDAEDGNSSFAATLSAITGPDAAGGIGSQTASCSYTDAGGLTATASVTYNIVDPSPPTIGYTLSPASPDGNNGWYKSSVTLTWTVTEGDSPSTLQKTGCVDQNITADQGATQYSCSATSAGGSTGPVDVTIKRDATVPTINGTPSPAANGFGWNKTDVVVSFTCGDNLSGVTAANCGPDQTLSGEGAGQSATGNAEDNAGNTASATVSNINIDKTAPNVSLVGGPANGGSYYFGSVPLAPTCSASDGLSGLDGNCAVTGYGTTVGSHTVTASAKDKAGNESTTTATYTVLAWTLNGFYQPVDMNGVLNTVKNGSTVPLKFEIFAGSNELTDTGAIDSFKVFPINCATAGTATDDIELVTTGGTTLRYDATGGQFIQNWQTPKMPGLCFKVTMTTDDGSSISALFKLK